MKELFINKDILVKIPENKEENKSPSFSAVEEYKESFKYYKKNGYVIIKDILKDKEVDQLLLAWNKEIKTYKGYLIRQNTSRPQKNIFNEKNWVMNSLHHIQTLPPKLFPTLTASFTGFLCENKKLADLISFYIKGKPKLVQSMFFEGNTATRAHYDSFYLDDETIGQMAACWVALEDIDWNAGRFFICPKSHLNKEFHNLQNKKLDEEDLSLEVFLQNNIKAIKKNNYEVRAPFLKKGEILIWNSLTIHGSLPDSNPKNSRASITMHFTRTNTKFRTYRHELNDLIVEEREYIDVHRLFSYDNPIFKFKLFTQRKFPKLKSILKDIIFTIKYKYFRKQD